MLNLNPYLNPWDVDPSDSENLKGVPFYLAKKTPRPGETKPGRFSKEKMNKNFVLPKPEVMEEIAKIKAPKVKNPVEEVLAAKTPDAKDFDFVRVGEDPVSQETSVSSPAPSEQELLTQAYYESLKRRKGRQDEVWSDYDALKAQGRPTGFSTLDLSPAFAFVDHLTGSKLAPSYKAPTVGKEYDAKLQAAQELAFLNDDKLTADQLQGMSFNRKAFEFDEGQNREDSRLDKTLRNAIEVAKINAKARRDNPFSSLPADKFGYQVKRDMQEDMRKLSEKMTPMNSTLSMINEAEGLLDQYPDAPGTGFEKFKWDSMLPDNGDLRRSLNFIVQNYTNQMSGAAFTDAERRQYQKALGDIATSNPNSIRNGLKSLRQLTDTKISSVRRGYTPEVQAMYDYNSTGRTVKVSNGKETLEISNATEQDIREAMADGFRVVP